MSYAVQIEGLSKSFGSTRALDGLSMEVRTGEVCAFLGPNGAGKSTTIRILLGLMRADTGRVDLLGGDPWRDAVDLHHRVVYVPGDVNLWPSLTGGQTIDVLQRLRPSVDVRRRDDLVEQFELDPTKRCRTYSKGNRQKVALVAALSCDVDLYVLDEPTSGLDPLMEARFQDCVRGLRDAGRTVLLSSHILDEAERLGDSVTIIRDGRAVQSGRLEDLRHLARRRLTLTLRDDACAVADLAGVHDVEVDGRHVTLLVDHDRLPAVMSALAELGITELVSEAQSLEELFMEQYAQVRA